MPQGLFDFSKDTLREATRFHGGIHAILGVPGPARAAGDLLDEWIAIYLDLAVSGACRRRSLGRSRCTLAGFAAGYEHCRLGAVTVRKSQQVAGALPHRRKWRRDGTILALPGSTGSSHRPNRIPPETSPVCATSPCTVPLMLVFVVTSMAGVAGRSSSSAGKPLMASASSGRAANWPAR